MRNQGNTQFVGKVKFNGVNPSELAFINADGELTTLGATAFIPKTTKVPFVVGDMTGDTLTINMSAMAAGLFQVPTFMFDGVVVVPDEITYDETPGAEAIVVQIDAVEVGAAAEAAYMLSTGVELVVAGVVLSWATGTVVESKLTASDLQSYDYFGVSVALSEGIAVIGASGKATQAGACYLFDTVTGTEMHKLLPSDPGVSDYFGNSVAISGNIIVVGAYGEDPEGVGYAGSAYIFDATTGQELHELSASDLQTTDYFGTSVVISGNTIVVGARTEDPEGVSNAGSAYIYKLS